MSYDSLDLILVQTLEKTLMDGEGGAFAGPAEHERVGSWVGGDCEPGHWNAGLRGELADFRLEPSVFARSKIVKMTCESNNNWTDQVLEQYYEESAY